MTITQDDRTGYALNLNPDHVCLIIGHLQIYESARMTGTIYMTRTYGGADFSYRPDSGVPEYLGSITVSEERGA